MKRITPPVLLGLLTLGVPLAAQEHDLRVTAKKGASLWYTQEAKQEQAVDMGGMQMETGHSLTFTVFVTVKDKDEKGQLLVEAKIVRVQGSMSFPGIDVDFDSADGKPGEGDAAEEEGSDEMGMPDPDAIGRGATSLAGTTFTAKVDPFGNVESMEGIDKALEAARKKAGRMGAMMLGADLDQSAMERLIESAFGSPPSKPTAVGSAWERSDEDKTSPMPVANKMKLTLTKVDDESFEITASGTIEKAAAAAAAEAKEGEDENEAMAREMSAKMKIENGKITGTTRVSRKDGFTIESNSVLSMDLTVPSPMGGDVSIAQKSTTVTKRTTEANAMPKKEAPKDEGKEAPKETGR